ncbi:MAG: anti-sigma factor family protein, partial [Planctomycetota bacterium]
MENNCQNNQEQITELIAGTLPAEEAAALQEHLGRCPACSKYLEALRADDKLLGDFVAAMRPTVSRIEKNVAEVLNRPLPGKAAGSVSVWRKIMKSRITRFATAAAIILAAGILLRSLNDGTAWAKVVA